MKNGLYRNSRDAELHVTGFASDVGAFKTLGGIYRAEAHSLFGVTPYLVTDQSLADCGFELITEES